MFFSPGEGVQRRGVDLQGHLRGGHLHAEVQEGLVWNLIEKRKQEREVIKLCWAQWVWFQSIAKTWDKFVTECRGEHQQKKQKSSNSKAGQFYM